MRKRGIKRMRKRLRENVCEIDILYERERYKERERMRKSVRERLCL